MRLIALKRRLVVLIVLFIFMALIHRFSTNHNQPITKSGSSPITKSPCPLTINQSLQNSTKSAVILFWTKFFDDPIRVDGDPECEECLITTDRCYLPFADLVVFHWIDIDLDDLPTKLDGQRWVLYNMESPETIDYRGAWRQLQPIVDQIDYVVTYRTESSYFTPYGKILKLRYPLDKYKPKTETKSKPIAWLVSNCDTKSNREKYVKELSNFIQVDIYGNCGPYKCPRQNSTKCYEDIERDYFFYLSFENSLCKDYVTEKFFSILNYDLVPITFGSANYSNLIPKEFYINALDFANPKELATFLKHLMHNKNVYNRMFDWKKQFRVISNESVYVSFSNFCKEFVKDRDEGVVLNPMKLINFKQWWFDDAKCYSWKPKN